MGVTVTLDYSILGINVLCMRVMWGLGSVSVDEWIEEKGGTTRCLPHSRGPPPSSLVSPLLSLLSILSSLVSPILSL